MDGYRRRHRLAHQLLAECVYAGQYAMRDPQGKTVIDLFPMLFNDDDDDPEPPISDEEAEDLQALMAAENARLQEER